MSDTISQQILDYSVRHAVNLQRFSLGVAGDVIKLIDAAEKEIIARVLAMDSKELAGKRLQAILKELRDISDAAYWQAFTDTVVQMKQLAADEAEWSAQLLERYVPVSYSVTRPTAATLGAIVSTSPVVVGPDKALLLEDLFASMAAGHEESIRAAIRLGMVQGETIPQLAARLRELLGIGARGTDKATKAARRGAVAMARTIVNHTSNQAAQATWDDNSDIMHGWRFVATLDGRTTITCASLSGRVFPLGKGPIPPRHVGCRSISLPVLKSWRELGYAGPEYRGVERASKDGYVDARIGFDAWLRGQPVGVQRELLGKKRQELFAAGLKVRGFTDLEGRVYSLKELYDRNGALFAQVFGQP